MGERCGEFGSRSWRPAPHLDLRRPSESQVTIGIPLNTWAAISYLGPNPPQGKFTTVAGLQSTQALTFAFEVMLLEPVNCLYSAIPGKGESEVTNPAAAGEAMAVGTTRQLELGSELPLAEVCPKELEQKSTLNLEREGGTSVWIAGI